MIIFLPKTSITYCYCCNYIIFLSRCVLLKGCEFMKHSGLLFTFPEVPSAIKIDETDSASSLIVI